MFGVLQSDMIQLGNLFTRLLADELRKKGKVASGRLVDSINPKIEVSPESIELAIYMAPYAKEVAAGKPAKPDGMTFEEYKKSKKRVSIYALTQWVIDKGIETNRIEAVKIAFAVRYKIFMMGIKPTDFVSMVFESAQKEAEENIGNGVFKGVEQEVDGIIAQFDGDN